jgi:hypothetical protein
MSVENISQYENQKIILTVEVDGSNAELEGTALAANEMGVLLRPKGKVSSDLYEAAKIESIRLAPVNSSELKASELKIVKVGSTRKHLLDRHGYTLAQVNTVAELDAYEAHSELDHSGLGHTHVESTETPAEAAVAAEG